MAGSAVGNASLAAAEAARRHSGQLPPLLPTLVALVWCCCAGGLVQAFLPTAVPWTPASFRVAVPQAGSPEPRGSALGRADTSSAGTAHAATLSFAACCMALWHVRSPAKIARPGRGSSTKRFFMGKPDEQGEGKVQQLIGMKGASDEDVPLWKIRLQLCKPVTWPPLLFGVVAGTCASGNFDWFNATGEDWVKLLFTMVLSGPVMVGYTQTLNDWYDKDLDAINEPYRPIPSGKITEEQVWQQIIALGTIGLIMAGVIDVWQKHTFPAVFLVAAVGGVTAYIYSAPPLKLKANWIPGCYALGASYVALPWWAGQSAFGAGTPGAVSQEIILLTLFYSVAAVGIAIVNDFKSYEGDKKLGLSSAPVVFGIDTAKYMAPAIKDSIQLCIVAYLYSIGCTEYAVTLFVLILPQLYFAKTLFLEDPLENDVKYQGFSLPFFSIGTIVTASAIGGSPLH
mmetsp:Transcript_1003/g.2232  ORF Transcript_1003/g.2232 Transcript_1003/m.2232 type:complete len:455 (+) Transcript_1003:37-1401(+)